MAEIASIDAKKIGSFNAPRSTLTADDTITFNPSRKQLLVLSNDTAGSLNVKVDGDGGTTVAVAGVGNVDVTGGYTITVGIGASVAVILSSISAYCKGVVHLTGGTGAKAQLFDL